MSSAPIDIAFDFQAEVGKRDPDLYSATLQRYHQILWTKPLPSGALFALELGRVGSVRVLRHDSALGQFVFGSDTLANSNKKVLRPFYDQMGAEANLAWHRDGGTIGGRLIFPRNKVGGMQTLNQVRGTHPLIRDRLDLTLEAIRRHYAGEMSPLSAALERYADFFALFGNFNGYITFFLLDDLVEEGRVRFYIPFDDFGRSPLPRTFEQYQQFRAAQLAFVAARNQRILAHLRATN